ncbi:Metallocarboxypeptidase A-like protein [Paramyrothecium foliicola]|nr:Metallocarboxypeptidase A-like protein [Paramyrothecium foliicola]
MKFVAAALSLVLPLVAAKTSYDGYKAFHIDSHDDYDGVESALAGLNYVSLGCEHDHKTFDVAIAPESLKDFEALNFDASVITEDLGADFAVESTFKPYLATRKVQGVGDLPDVSYFNSYHTFEEHEQFLVDLQASFQNNSQLFVAGESLEGRPIQGIHLYGKDGPGNHPAIIWHGNVHAREWITGVTVEYLAYKLVDGYQKNTAVPASTLDNYDFYIMPVVNPDGFVYTTQDRMWRKNRQVRPGKNCVGTDINRNWPHQWNVPGGSSPDACSETYRGEAPGDTPEMAVLTNHTKALAESTGIKMFIDWHSFSQLILLPYGYSCTAQAENIDKQMELAGGVAEAIKGVNGLTFEYGPTCTTIYPAAGGSMDWAYDIAGAELAWGFELRPAGGGNGFVIPPSNIVPSGEENWAGMEYLFSVF